MAKIKTKHKVRAVVMNDAGEVFGMRANAKHVLQLAGGGRHASESPIKALKREIREETGFKVKVRKLITTITVFRNGVREVTLCYLTMIKKTVKTSLTKNEIRRGLRVKRYKNLSAFCKALKRRVKRYGRSAALRDYTLATAAVEAI